MDKEAAKLRRDLGRVETGRGKRYPAKLQSGRIGDVNFVTSAGESIVNPFK